MLISRTEEGTDVTVLGPASSVWRHRHHRHGGSADSIQLPYQRGDTDTTAMVALQTVYSCLIRVKIQTPWLWWLCRQYTAALSE